MVLHAGARKCSAYGLDFWNDWCYGEMENTEFAGTGTFAGTKCDFWMVNDIVVSNTQYTCIPVTKSRASGEVTVYYDYTPTVVATMFIPDPSCHLSDVVGPAPAEHLDMIRAVAAPKKRV